MSKCMQQLSLQGKLCLWEGLPIPTLVLLWLTYMFYFVFFMTDISGDSVDMGSFMYSTSLQVSNW